MYCLKIIPIDESFSSVYKEPKIYVHVASFHILVIFRIDGGTLFHPFSHNEFDLIEIEQLFVQHLRMLKYS